MSTIATTQPSPARLRKKTPYLPVKLLAFTGIITIATLFVLKYVFRYYFHYSEAAFTDPILGAANYWVDRGWLLMHITGGMTALLIGPWQFWTGFRNRYARLHRWMGRMFLGAVAVGSIGAYHMALHTTFGWAFGFSLLMMATAWFSTAAMAYYAILKRRIPEHKEWMVRAYVVTFAFVTFRILSDYSPFAHFYPESDRSITISWSSWVIPLMITEVVLQLRRMRSSSAG